MRQLKSPPYLRTNQFEVADRLNGLEERFRINDREHLADAWRDRLNALNLLDTKWHPEILFLLLELSDRPTHKTRLSDLDSLAPNLEKREPALRWEDIAKEDGWDQEAALWNTIPYSDSSADEEDHEELVSDSDNTSVSGRGYTAGRLPEDFIIHPEDSSLLDSLRMAQEWRAGPSSQPTGATPRKTAVTELNVVREVLFMLQGLETTIFEANGSAVANFQMSHTAWETHKAVMNYFAESGRQLYILRSFVDQPQSSPHLQVLQDCICRRLEGLDDRVVELQKRMASPNDQIAVSLIAIKKDLAPCMESLYPLSDILEQVSRTMDVGTFHYLELLFEKASIAHFTNQPSIFNSLARIFLDCFHVYLRPIRLWMDEGRLIRGDELFFVSESLSEVPLSSIWKDRFKLRKIANGSLHAPKFLQPAASKIFNAGKNIVLLRKLGRFEAAHTSRRSDEPPLDFESMCPEEMAMAPFPDLFDEAFEKWIQSKYRKTSSTLRDVLLDECDLSPALNALECLYFMSDGSASSAFCEDLFGKIKVLDSSWQNQYALTAIGSDVFASHIDITRLSIIVDDDAENKETSISRGSVRTALPSIKIQYRLPWPLQMIVSTEALEHYQAVFTLLLQVRMALHALQKHKLLDGYWTDHESWDERALFYSSRSNLLWFCTTFQTYLSTLILIPNAVKMRNELRVAQDVDAMISIHSHSMKQIVDEACLGSRLAPIRDCILDILDLGIKLEHARSTNADADRNRDGPRARGQQQSSELLSGLLRQIKADFSRHLRFVVGGLRSVARANSDAPSAKWDILAEMLQPGTLEERSYS